MVKSSFLWWYVRSNSANSYDVGTCEVSEILVYAVMQDLDFRSRFKFRENWKDIFFQSKLVCQFIS